MVGLFASEASAASLTVQWEPASNGATLGYTVLYGTTSGVYTQQADAGLVTSFRVDGLSYSTRYCFAVRAYGAGGVLSDVSTEVCGMTEPEPATVPSGGSGDGSSTGGSSGGGGSVISDPAAATFVRADTTTQGNWHNVFGTDGYAVIGDATSYPSYATVMASGQQSFTWDSAPSSARALQRAAAGRIAATWYTGSTFSIDVNFTDNASHQLALYAIDWDDASRSQRIDIVNASTGVVLDSRTLTGFTGGQYLVWTIQGHVRVDVVRTGPQNAVVSGVFFDGVPVTGGSGGSGGSGSGGSSSGGSDSSSGGSSSGGSSSGGSSSGGSSSSGSDSGGPSAGGSSSGGASSGGGSSSGGGASSGGSSSGGASGGGGSSSASAAATGGSSASGAASVPGVFGLSGSVRNDRYLDLSWTPAPGGASGYRVELGRTPGQTSASTVVGGLSSTLDLGGFGVGSYYVRVRAMVGGGYGDLSDEIGVTVGGAGSAPQAFAATMSGRSANLSWQAPADGHGASAYEVEVGSSSGGSDVARVTVATLSTVIQNLADGTFYMRVRAIRGGVAGDASREARVTISGGAAQCGAAPASPTGFVATSQGSLAVLSWQPGGGDAPTSYHLFVGSAPGLQDLMSVPLGAATGLTATAANGAYYLRLVASNACGSSAMGAEAVLTIGPAVGGIGSSTALPGAPVGLTQQVSNGTVSLTWSPPVSGGAATRYIIEATTPAGAVALDTGNAATFFSHPNTPPGQYLIRVRAANGGGVGPASAAVTVVVP